MSKLVKMINEWTGLPEGDEKKAAMDRIREFAETCTSDQMNERDIGWHNHNLVNMTPLYLAVKSGEVDFVKFLLACGARVDGIAREGRSALHGAASAAEPDLEMVEALLAAGADCNARDDCGNTPLLEAVMCNADRDGMAAIMRRLLDEGADVNIGNNMWDTALNRAAKVNAPESILRLFLEQGAQPEISDESGITPLYWPIRRGDKKIAGLLLKHGANINHRDREGRTPLHWIAGEPDSAQMVKWVLGHDARIDGTNRERETVLHAAARTGSAETVRLLLEHGADALFENKRGRTALHGAVLSRCLEKTAMLLDCAAWPDLPQDLDLNYEQLHWLLAERGQAAHTLYGFAAHMYFKLPAGVTATERRRMLGLLLEYGLDVSAQDESGNTLLHHLCKYRASAQDLSLLLSGQGEMAVNLRNNAGNTPLHDYLGYYLDGRRQANPAGIRALLEAGADPDLKNKYDRCAQDAVRINIRLGTAANRSAIAQLLRAHSGAGGIASVPVPKGA